MVFPRLAFVIGFFVGGVWFFACSAFGLLALAVTRGSRDNVFYFARTFCGGIARLMGWKIDVDAARLGAHRPCVFVSNHQSIMDVLTFGSVVPRRTVAVGKAELARIPLFGWFFIRSGNLVIDRGNSDAARQMMAAAGKRVQAEGLSVWFTPEGHRNSSGTLLPFKTGAFRLAAAAKVPIVPVVAAPLGSVVDTGRWISRRGTLAVSVLDPVAPLPSPSDEGIPAQASAVREAMQREFARLANADS